MPTQPLFVQYVDGPQTAQTLFVKLTEEQRSALESLIETTDVDAFLGSVTQWLSQQNSDWAPLMPAFGSTNYSVEVSGEFAQQLDGLDLPYPSSVLLFNAINALI